MTGWKALGVILTILALAAGIGAFAFNIWLGRYLHSEAFAGFLANKIEGVMQADVDLPPLSWTDTEAYAGELKMAGREGAAFSSLSSERIRARIRLGAVREGVWEISEITTDRLELDLGPGRPGRGLAAELDEAAELASGGNRFFGKLLPSAVEVKKLTAANLILSLPQQDGGRIHMQGSRVELVPMSGSEGFRLTGSGGTLQLDGLEEALEIREFSASIADGTLFIDDARLAYLGNSELTAQGRAGDGLALRLSLTGLEVDEVLPAEWRPKIGGVIRGTIDVSDRGGERSHSGILALDGASLEDLPLLDRIARYTRVDRFRRLFFDRAQARFRREGERLEITELVMESDGLLRVEGEIVLVGESIDAHLMIGVTPDSLARIPGAEGRVFVESNESPGYLWAPLRVTGSVHKPEEDMTPRLIAAAGHELILGAPAAALGLASESLGAASGLLGIGGKPNDEGEAAGGENEQEGRRGIIGEGVGAMRDVLDLGGGVAKEVFPLFGD
jgi:hypothetical protein